MIPGEVDAHTEIPCENMTTKTDEEQLQAVENQPTHQPNETSSFLLVKQDKIRKIEGDLSELMHRLNSFTSTSQECDFKGK